MAKLTPEEIKAKFPEGAVVCKTCGEAYSSMEVYKETHKPPYIWKSACGHAKLRWKNPTPPPLTKRGFVGRVLDRLRMIEQS